MSEAFYLDDPEGNGIEVYNDRPKEQWQIKDGMVVMQTKQLDIEAIVREGEPNAAYPPRRTDCASATSICGSATSSRPSNSTAAPWAST